MTAEHHTVRGYRNPWPDSEPRGLRDVIRWSLERRKKALPPDPAPGSIPIAAPSFANRVGDNEVSATWVGHSTVLLQLGAINILTDPMWSERASPVPFAGPCRLVEPAFGLESLPSIDVVLISHNHYDHLDKPTVRALARRMPEAEWIVPLGLSRLLRKWGADRAREADWWQTLEIRTESGTAHISCTPAQHFSARGLWDRGRTLWCSWALAAGKRRAFFAGDTAYHPEFPTIGERYGPFDLSMLPIGAYEPRWFMKTVHMNPPEALRAYAELAGARAGELAMLPIHWGTFRLTDEAIDQPPTWTAQLWADAGYDRNQLWLLEHGETRGLVTGDW